MIRRPFAAELARELNARSWGNAGEPFSRSCARRASGADAPTRDALGDGPVDAFYASLERQERGADDVRAALGQGHALDLHLLTRRLL